MAKRGTVKRRSVEQENHIAALYGGRRSASSGAADNDQGDVRTPELLIECKTMGEPEQTKVKRPGFAKDLEKITEEAWGEGRVPVLAVRWYDPDSLLSDRDGWVDVVIKRAVDDSPE
jgi:hypothetical protein